MTAQAKTLHEITNDAIHLLCQQMGVANTVRFLNQFIAGYGNYTVERDELFRDMSLGDVLSEIRKQRSSRAS